MANFVKISGRIVQLIIMLKLINKIIMNVMRL